MTTAKAITIATDHPQVSSTAICTFLGVLAFGTIAIDFVESLFHHSSFYITESLLFSSFWVLSFPLLKVQVHFAGVTESFYQRLLLVVLLIVVHLTSFPAFVWLLSTVFYYHTFSYRQTLVFGVTTYSIKTLLLYTLLLLRYPLCKRKDCTPAATAVKNEEEVPTVLTSLTVPDTNRRKLLIKTEDILYFSSASPYVRVHHSNKNYLYSQTLQLLMTQLDPEQFIRIHKSCVVNVLFVASYQSRLNGDYDLTLKDGTELRLSRNYAATFKSIFERSHRLTL